MAGVERRCRRWRVTERHNQPIAPGPPRGLNAAHWKSGKASLLMRAYLVVAAFCSALAGLAVFLPGGAGAGEGQTGPLRCTFEAGTSIAYAGGSYEPSPAKALAFNIADIDLERQEAVLQTGSGGQGHLKIVRAVNANHFLEVVNEGFLNITTVYDIDPQRKAHPAVHSRHLGLLGEPVVAQYYGFCTPG